MVFGLKEEDEDLSISFSLKKVWTRALYGKIDEKPMISHCHARGNFAPGSRQKPRPQDLLKLI